MTPLLTQSDMQSVGNGAIGMFARAFASKMCETAVSRLRMSWTYLQDLSRAVSRFSRRSVAGNHLRYPSNPTGSNTITIPDWIGKNLFFSDPIPNRVFLDPIPDRVFSDPIPDRVFSGPIPDRNRI